MRINERSTITSLGSWLGIFASILSHATLTGLEVTGRLRALDNVLRTEIFDGLEEGRRKKGLESSYVCIVAVSYTHLTLPTKRIV